MKKRKIIKSSAKSVKVNEVASINQPFENCESFQSKVYAACKLIPKGKVSTYKLLALSIGSHSAYRAVGSALRRNPFAPVVHYYYRVMYHVSYSLIF